MRASQIVGELNDLGARIEAVDGHLRINVPKGAISADLREELRSHKAEVLRLVGRRKPPCGIPARAATDPYPPQLATNEEMGQARVRFAEHGIQPPWDDLVGAVSLERRRTWCEQTLEDLYAGRVTLTFLQNGQLAAFPRGLAS